MFEYFNIYLYNRRENAKPKNEANYSEKETT